MKRNFLLFLLGIILVSCGQKSKPPKPTPPNIFENPICKPPCWQNITPGVTTEQDALAVFAKFADRNGVSDITDPYADGYDKNITFSSAIGSGLVFADTLNERISVMKFEGVFGGNITLQHAIELFGEPESVVVEEFGEWDQITLLDPQNGIAFGWPISGASPRVASGKAEISPNTNVGLIWFFDPNQYDRFLKAYGFVDLTKNDLHPWVGYGNIKDKYWPPVAQPPQ